MPLYDYQCSECGFVEDRLFSSASKPQEFEGHCKGCGKTTLFTHVYVKPMSIVSGVNFVAKCPGDFKYRMQQLKKHYPAMQSAVTG